MPAYAQALEREAELRAQEFPARIPTVFFGGGTPSCLPEELLTRLFSKVFASFQVLRDAEITVEMNPDDACAAKLRAFKEMGANRLSIGCQAFDDETLRFLERRHSAEQAACSVGLAREAGFENINLDIMCAIPGQTTRGWHRTLEKAVELQPQHLSVYTLTFEPGTRLWQRMKRGEISPVGDEAELAAIETAQHFLETHGYERYEISNYALPGKRCAHNLGCWRGMEYLGLGAGAHSFINRVRWRNARGPADYIRSLEQDILPVEAAERLDNASGLEEALLVGLRLREGVETSQMLARFGRDPAKVYRKTIEELSDSGYIECQNGRLRLSAEGWKVANAVLARLVAT
jgi:oxygen-independent coproporphyrinogen-3 oxidase